MAESRGALDAEKSAMGASLDTALRAAEAVAKREALENFMDELRVEQRHYTRENRMLMQNRKSLVLQERMYFRNIPLPTGSSTRSRSKRAPMWDAWCRT